MKHILLLLGLVRDRKVQDVNKTYVFPKRPHYLIIKYVPFMLICAIYKEIRYDIKYSKVVR